MTILTTRDIPAHLLDIEPPLERAGVEDMTVTAVPACIGWARHAQVRSSGHEMETHVCASSYDHIRLDVQAHRVAALYEALPQPSTFVGIAGVPGQLSVREAVHTLNRWGARSFASTGQLPDPDPADAYVASPIFALYRAGRSVAPVVLVATRYRITTPRRGQLEVHVTLDRVATAPEARSHGFAHLAVLEAARWLGMLTSGVVLHGRRAIALTQVVHAYPATALEEHLGEVFAKNFGFFTVTDESIEAARSERALGLLDVDSRRYGLAAIQRNTGIIERISRVGSEPQELALNAD